MGRLTDKRGAALLYAIIASFIVILITGIFIRLLTDEIRINKLTETELQARYLAEAGIEHGLLATGPITETVNDSDGTVLYSYTVTISSGRMTVVSNGYIDGAARYSISCEVEKNKIDVWNESPM